VPLAGDIIRSEKIFTSWQSFDPTWSNITVGNGTSVGFWRRAGDDLIEFAASLTWGSTTSSSGSPFGLELPGSLSGNGSLLRQIVPALAVDTSAGRGYAGHAWLASGGGATLDRFYGEVADDWDSDSPMTWASGDILAVQGWIRVTAT